MHTGRIAIFSVDRPDLKIKKLTTSRPEFLVAKAEPLTAEDRQHLKAKAGGYRIDVQVKPGMPLGAFQDELVIETDHPRQPEIKVSIKGRTTGPISVVPAVLRMPDVSSKDGKKRDMTILVRGARPTLFVVAHKPKKIEVEIEPNDTNTQKGRYRMTITVPPGTSPGPIEDEIILKTDHPKASEIKVPITILISKTSVS
jgi:hypothetical protein